MIKKAIVTGGTGFIGSQLCTKLLNQGYQVSIITRKSSKYSYINNIKDKLNIFEYDGDIVSLIKFFNEEAFDVVFHLASLFIFEHNPNDIDNLINSNLKFGLHVLEAMKESNTKLIINTGTSWQHSHTNEYKPVNLYSATKEAYEALLKYYVESKGIRAITLKLFDTYGETDQRNKLITVLNKHADNRKVLKMSHGEQFIDLVHVDDVTNAFLRAFDYLIENKHVKYNTYGVASGNKVRIKELVLLFEEVTGKKIKVEWCGKEYNNREIMELWDEYKTLVNWNCNITLKEGLSRYRD